MIFGLLLGLFLLRLGEVATRVGVMSAHRAAQDTRHAENSARSGGGKNRNRHRRQSTRWDRTAGRHVANRRGRGREGEAIPAKTGSGEEYSIECPGAADRGDRRAKVADPCRD